MKTGGDPRDDRDIGGWRAIFEEVIIRRVHSIKPKRRLMWRDSQTDVRTTVKICHTNKPRRVICNTNLGNLFAYYHSAAYIIDTRHVTSCDVAVRWLKRF